uniref:Bm448 n=1 Tax=Brugia malayi TaxID=6279 RepID=A0A1I9G2A8_BRUMA|nr:Bm448 [Brugia malayi]
MKDCYRIVLIFTTCYGINFVNIDYNIVQLIRAIALNHLCLYTFYPVFKNRGK